MIYFIVLCFYSMADSMPDWVQNYRKVYPDSKYLCQRGSGKKAEEARGRR